MSTKKQVKLVPMYVDDIEKLYRIADSLGLPFRKLLSELAEKGGDLYLASKGDLEGIKNLYTAIHNMGSLGFLLLPVSIVNMLIEGKKRLDEVCEETRRLGEAIGSIYSLNNYTSINEISGLVKLLFLDASQLNVNGNGSQIKITINAPGRNQDLIKLTLCFLDSFFNTLGYKKNIERINGSLIILVYVRGD